MFQTTCILAVSVTGAQSLAPYIMGVSNFGKAHWRHFSGVGRYENNDHLVSCFGHTHHCS